MKGLSSLERTVLECLGNKTLTYHMIQEQSGLHDNVCFNVLQALIIRNVIGTDGVNYKVRSDLSPLMMEEINSTEAREMESLELIEAVIEKKSDKVFRLRKIAMEERDEKIFLAMLSNIESFLNDAHKKAKDKMPHKEYKVVFWGVGEAGQLMSQIVAGR
jgi:hypothetical protein